MSSLYNEELSYTLSPFWSLGGRANPIEHISECGLMEKKLYIVVSSM